MYDLADWGRPLAPPEFSRTEKLTTQLPHSLVRVLRSRARARGVSINTLIERLLHDALALPSHLEAERVAAEMFD